MVRSEWHMNTLDTYTTYAGRGAKSLVGLHYHVRFDCPYPMHRTPSWFFGILRVTRTNVVRTYPGLYLLVSPICVLDT